MIKKALITLLALTALNGTAAPAEYPATFVVTMVDTERDMVLLEDSTGNEWEYFSADDWMVGDIASAICSDNGTESIYDDEIIKLEYSGFVK